MSTTSFDRQNMTNKPEPNPAVDPWFSESVTPFYPPAPVKAVSRRLVLWVGLAAVVLVAAGGVGLWWVLSRADGTPAPAPVAEAKRKELGKNLYFEVQGETRRVIVKATVCLR